MQNGLSLVVPAGNVADVHTFPSSDDTSPLRETVVVGEASAQAASCTLWSASSPRSGQDLIQIDAPQVLAVSEDGTVTVSWDRENSSASVEVVLPGKLFGVLELPVDDTSSASQVFEQVQRAWKALSIQGASLPKSE